MKISKNIFVVIAGLLIIVAFWGPLDQKSHSFVKNVTEKNLKIMHLVSDVKLVLSGINKINIPFISGHTGDLITSLQKTKDYLLKISAITFSQLMLLSISKSWVMKLVLLVLFALCLLKNTQKLSAKFLILFLAINPGLSLFTTTVEALSKASKIDFGHAYITKLEASVQAIKNEKAQLMTQHARQEAQIKNGEEHVNLFGKLKEDVAYDFKKAGDTIHGDYTEIRLLIHEAGHEMTAKVYNFCTMVIFCFMLLPLGYALMIFILFKSLFGSKLILERDTKQQLEEVEEEVGHLSFFGRVRNSIHAAVQEFQGISRDFETDISHVKEKVKSEGISLKANMNYHIENEEKKVKEGFSDLGEKAKVELGSQLESIEEDASDVEGRAKRNLTKAEQKVEDKVSALNQSTESRVDHMVDEAKEEVSRVTDQIEGEKSSIKTQVESAVDLTEERITKEENVAKSYPAHKISKVKNEAREEVSDVENKAKDEVHTAQSIATSDATEIENKFKQEDHRVKADIEQNKAELENQIEMDKEVYEDAIDKVEKNIKSKDSIISV